MPRSGGVYSLPAGTKAVSSQPVQSVPYNSYLDDMVVDANAARPITAGGTGAPTVSGALANFGLTGFVDKDAVQTLTNKSLSDATTFFVDDVDGTKKLQFQLSNIGAGTTRTWQFPDANGVVLGINNTAVVTNKSLVDASTSFIDDGDNTKILKFQVAGIATATTQTITWPNASGIAILDTAAQRLSNKEFIDNTTYFISNANGTKRVSFDITNVSNATTRTWAFPDTSDTIVGLATSQTLTSKTLTSPTINAATFSGNIGGTFAFTGVPSAPTAAGGTNTTQIATTAFVTAAVGGAGAVTLTGAQTISGTKTFSVTQKFSAGDSVTVADYMQMFPTDYGLGKPRLNFSKETTNPLQWEISVFDTTGIVGTLNLQAANLTWNSVPLVTTTGAQTLTNKTLTSPAIAGATLTGAMSGGTVNPTTLQQGGSQAYVRSNALGTVSQSAGVPTGAIIESGSNANGEYTKWADGTMICKYIDSTGISSTAAIGSIFHTSGFPATWTFPAAFASGTTPFVGITVPLTGNRWGSAEAQSNVAASWQHFSATSSSAAIGSVLMAYGRWF